MPAANAYVRVLVSQHIYCYYCCANTTPRSRKTNRTCRDPPPRIQREAHATTTTINSSNGCLVSMSPAAPSQPQLTHSYARQGSGWRGRGYTHRVREGAVHFRDVFFFGCIYPTAGWHATIVFFSLQKPGQTGPKERKPVRRRAPTVFPSGGKHAGETLAKHKTRVGGAAGKIPIGD